MGWFLNDKGLGHERINSKCLPNFYPYRDIIAMTICGYCSTYTLSRIRGNWKQKCKPCTGSLVRASGNGSELMHFNLYQRRPKVLKTLRFWLEFVRHTFGKLTNKLWCPSAFGAVYQKTQTCLANFSFFLLGCITHLSRR